MYNQAVFIDWEDLGNSEYYRGYSKTCAEYLHWDYREQRGDPSLLEKMLNGIFDPGEVLVIPAAKTISPSYTEGIVSYS